MANKRKAILVRLPPDLWEELNAWARHELRSVNAQIEYLLREAVVRRRGPRAGRETGANPAPPEGEGGDRPRAAPDDEGARG